MNLVVESRIFSHHVNVGAVNRTRPIEIAEKFVTGGGESIVRDLCADLVITKVVSAPVHGNLPKVNVLDKAKIAREARRGCKGKVDIIVRRFGSFECSFINTTDVVLEGLLWVSISSAILIQVGQSSTKHRSSE